MKKKEPENVQETASKSKKLDDLRTARPAFNEPKGGSKPIRLADDPRFAQAVQNYEAGLKLLQAHKYDKAKACLEKVVAGPSPELADRAATHLSTCTPPTNRNTATFNTHTE